MTRRSTTAALAAVLLLAGWLRFTGLDWDEGAHTHPDERFLTMVVEKIHAPESAAEYFSTERSPLNPLNRGFKSYVYGTLPLFLVRGAAGAADRTSFWEAHLVGRALAAAFDTATVLLVFFLGAALYGRAAGIFGAFLSGAAVLQIQHAHFFVVESFLVFFVTLGALTLVRIQRTGSALSFIAFGAVLGAGLATKLTAALLLPAFGAALLVRWAELPPGERRTRAVPELAWTLLAAHVAFAVFRLAQPYAFESSWLPRFDRTWLSGLERLASFDEPSTKFPPSLQWRDRSVFFPLRNAFLYGLGPFFGACAGAALAAAGIGLLFRKRREHTVPVVLAITIIAFHSTQYVKVMRYLLPAYPVLAVLAGWLLARLWAAAGSRLVLRRAAAAAVCAGTLAWALAFTSIYRNHHTRAEASRWLVREAPAGASIAMEHWDEPQPAPAHGNPRGYSRRFRKVEIPIFMAESPAKIRVLAGALESADYVVVNSQRGWATLPRMPELYPAAIRYYEKLFGGELGFERVAAFSNYPRVFGIEVRTDLADESFSVYDHPKVFVFKKMKPMTRDGYAALLGSAGDLPTLEEIARLAR